MPVRTVSLWYPLVLYGLLYYQTGLINRVVVPQFLDGFLCIWMSGSSANFPPFSSVGNRGMHSSTSFFTFFISVII